MKNTNKQERVKRHSKKQTKEIIKSLVNPMAFKDIPLLVFLKENYKDD